MLLELRNKEKYSASWKVIDMTMEHVHFSYEPNKNSWWLNSTETHAPYFFLHELKQGKTPEISSTHLIDTSGNKKTEIIPNTSLQQTTPNGFLLSDKNGGNSEYFLERLSPNKSVSVTPELYLENTSHFETFKETIKFYRNEEIITQCEYLETNTLIYITYFIKKDSNLSCEILVLSKDGEVVLQDVLAQNLSGVFTESFCKIDDKIIYVKNDNEIHIID